MPDDLTSPGPQDRSRISLLEPHEVQYWADKFNVSKERLSEANAWLLRANRRCSSLTTLKRS
jgi:Protein of unknown function (DUF3606)